MTVKLTTRQHFFLRRAAKYLMVMLLPCLIAILCSIYFSFKNAESGIRQRGEQTLEAVEMHFEQVLSHMFSQSELLTGNVRTSMALRNFTINNDVSYSNAVFLSALGAAMRSVVDSYDYIDNIYIYLDDAQRCMSASQGVLDVSALHDSKWLESYRSMPENTKRTISSYELQYGGRVLAFIERMLLQPGGIAVSINAERLEAAFRTLLARQYETAAVFDASGNLLLRADNMPRNAMTDSELLEVKLNMQEPGWQTVGNRQIYVSTLRLDNLTLCAIADWQLMQTQIVGNLVANAWIFLANLALAIFLAYTTTRRSFRHISDIMDMFEQAEQNEPVPRKDQHYRDEYDMVMNNVVYMHLKQNQLHNRLQEQQYEKEHSEMVALQAQINPHFLFNTLQTLEMQIRTGKGNPMDDGDLVRHISEILRYALTDPLKKVRLGEELDYLRKYAAIQQYRFGDRFILYYSVDDGLENAAVFRLLLQPLVENSILHGLKESIGRMYIEIEAVLRDNNVQFTVRDTGAGMTLEQLEKLRENLTSPDGRSIGLSNLNRRLQLNYGESSGLQINASPQEGTVITFTIPYEETD